MPSLSPTTTRSLFPSSLHLSPVHLFFHILLFPLLIFACSVFLGIPANLIIAFLSVGKKQATRDSQVSRTPMVSSGEPRLASHSAHDL